EDVDLTNLPNYGTLGRLKLKMNVPNGKTRVVIEGLKRVEISKIVVERKFILFSCKKETAVYATTVSILQIYFSKVA
ncbi:MAG: hypothetical protein J6R02_07185, partial [Alistipes sp.]|nr:hypothetical protein [Alistipes sp.]